MNVLRVASILIIGLNSGSQAAQTFHDTYGELYFLTWMLSYMLLIICIERFMLVERLKSSLARVRSAFVAFGGKIKNSIRFPKLEKKV